MNDLEIQRKNYPTVTELFASYAYKKLENIDKNVLEHASNRGIAVHKYIFELLQGSFIDRIPEQDEQPFIDSFLPWMDANFDSLTMCEKRLYDDDRKYSGEPDLVLKLKDGRLALVDLKAVANINRKSCLVQLAAYKKLLLKNNIEVDCALILHLLNTGKKCRVIEFDNNEFTIAGRIFERHLSTWNWWFRSELFNEQDC